MAAKKKDATEPIRLKASRYPEVDQGTACTQSSFKTNKKAFLFIGDQGGRHKAMFKLGNSIPAATKLATKQPENYQVGSTAWVTARFTDEHPLPKKLWEKWLDESYELTRSSSDKKSGPKKKAAVKKKAIKKATKNKTTKQAKKKK